MDREAPACCRGWFVMQVEGSREIKCSEKGPERHPPHTHTHPAMEPESALQKGTEQEGPPPPEHPHAPDP